MKMIAIIRNVGNIPETEREYGRDYEYDRHYPK